MDLFIKSRLKQQTLWIPLGLLVCSLAPGCTDSGGDPEWGRFRGPQGSGINDRHPLPERADPEINLAWKSDLPPGNSSPIVAARLVVVTGSDADRLRITALDLNTGEIRWEHSIPRERQLAVYSPNTPASSSPASDGSRIVCFFQDFGLMALDIEGRELWRRPLGPFRNIYGLAVSPIIAGERVILQIDQTSGSFLEAFSLSDGRSLWRVERSAGNGYSTPLTLSDGDEGVIVLAESFLLAGHAARDGRRLWSVEGLPWMMKSLPVATAGRFFVSGWGSTETGLVAVEKVPDFNSALRRLDRNEDGGLSPDELQEQRLKDWFSGLDRDQNGVLDSSEWDFYRRMLSGQGGLLAFRYGESPGASPSLAWRYARSVPEVASALVYRGLLYLINDGGILQILDPEKGQVLKRKRLPRALDAYFASPVAGDGKVYVVSQPGTVTVLEAGPEGRILSSSELGESVYASPTLAAGYLLIRTEAALYAFR